MAIILFGSEQYNVGTTVAVMDGLFRVSRDGTIFRRRGDDYVLAAQTKTSRHGKYLFTTAIINETQPHFYVHRLVALAYVPNPMNKPFAHHKDGNGKNNCADNLAWCTGSENTTHAYETGLIKKLKMLETHGVKCRRCGVLRLKLPREGLCSSCYQLYANQLKRKCMFIDKYADVDIDRLSIEELKMTYLRLAGKTCRVIGDHFGISGGAVWQRLYILHGGERDEHRSK